MVSLSRHDSSVPCEPCTSRPAVLLIPSSFCTFPRLLPEESTRPTWLLSHQHFLRVSPLDATLMTSPASIANKRLTVELNPLDATFTKRRGWGAPPFDVLTPIPPNVSNAFPIYPLCFHTLVALTGSTAPEQLFSNQPVTHSFRRDGGVPPSRPLPIFSGSLSRPQRFQRGPQPCRKEPVFHQSRVTSHQSRVMPPPVHNSTLGYALPHVYCPRAILPSLRPWDRPLSRRSS